ncbi:MAG: 3-oxoacyl-ACP reductase FabG [Xanthomonadales bacterium]|nr:3-oxoacyl-ACP reductase FabG [Xanthomonadales bacterium]
MSEQRVALVTGATRGIGAAILETLVSQGHRVVGTATSEPGAEGISARIEELGGTGAGMVLDVAEDGAADRLVKEVAEHHGHVTILVNNAGITRDQLLLRMSDADWDALMDTNLKGVFRLTKACLRGMMKARYGRVVNITSVIGQIGNAGQANYAAAKGGIIAFTKSVAREVGSRGITANCVAPGFVDTDMTRALPEQQRDALLAQVPLGTLGRPADIAAAVGFLVSDGAGYITGETINVNGGMHMA